MCCFVMVVVVGMYPSGGGWDGMDIWVCRRRRRRVCGGQPSNGAVAASGPGLDSSARRIMAWPGKCTSGPRFPVPLPPLFHF